MIDTYTGYMLLARDLQRSLDRVMTQPMVQRETEYYLENIGKVTSIDEFLEDTRLFNYAMKAHGLEDMAYAKAFMRKALEEGISDPESFANKLTDKRYAEFVRAFNFAALGADATTFNLANHGTVERYLTRATPVGGQPDEAYFKEAAYYEQNIVHVKSIEQLLDSDRLLLFALQAFGLEASFGDKAFIQEILEGGVDDPESLANEQENKAWAEFAKAFNFVRYGEDATTHNLALQPSVDKFVRQTLEQDAGEQNEGVRLALYFERVAPSLTNGFEILADKAVSQVVRTALGMPPAMAQMDIDKQAKLLEARVDFEEFQDPEKLSKFITRFTAMWEMNNPSSAAQSSVAQLFQPAQFGISPDTLMAIANLKR